MTPFSCTLDLIQRSNSQPSLLLGDLTSATSPLDAVFLSRGEDAPEDRFDSHILHSASSLLLLLYFFKFDSLFFGPL